MPRPPDLKPIQSILDRVLRRLARRRRRPFGLRARLIVARALLFLGHPRAALRFCEPRPAEVYDNDQGLLVDRCLDEIDREGGRSR